MNKLTTDERQLIVDQALVLIEQLYVHLPLKRAMHAVDPVQRLRLLRYRLKGMTDLEFHSEMVQTFTRLRDLHTNYILPEPFRSRVAYLPFRLQEAYSGGRCQYLVTEISDIVEDDPRFREGVVVTHWNGVRIERAIEVNADREAGSNPEARHACGLDAMTIRPLAMSLPPDESWVVVTYRDGRHTGEKRFEWRVRAQEQDAGSDPLTSRGSRAARMLGLDAKLELVRRTRRLLFAPKSVKAEREVSKRPRRRSRPEPGPEGEDYFSAVEQTPAAYVSRMPDVFSLRPVETPHGTYAYVRIRTFYVWNDRAFVREFIRILGLLPQNGLILDVRSNGGGNIAAGERLLQLLTPGPIDPERLHFINTPLTLRLCQENSDIRRWRDSIAQAVETGSTFSQGFPLLPAERYNDIGQKYHGPVVLLTDALCYSTTDIFSAGFQDHGIGKILGTSRNTGAGGANVWDHDILLDSLQSPDSPFKPLPKGASFRVSIRRTTRVGARAGEPLEDLGVRPDYVHRRTRRDVLRDNVDLIRRAALILKGMPSQYLSARLVPEGGGRRLAVTTRNIERLDLIVGGRAEESRDVSDGVAYFKLPSGRRRQVAELRGFRDDTLVAASRVNL